MRSIVQILREKKHLTQAELAEKTGLSLRTIQRIESGNTPKGFTLKALASALETDPKNLIEEKEAIRTDRAKLINFSALAGLVIPFGGIIFPLILTYKTRDSKNRNLGKNIVGIQIILTITFSILMIISSFIQKALSIKFPFFMISLIAFICLKLFIVIGNGINLNKKNELYIKLKNNIL